MIGILVFTLILLVLLATLLRQPMLLTPAYLFVGAWVIGRLWGRRAMAQIACERRFVDRAFLNDKVIVRVTVRNQGRLPVLWLRIHDSLHSGLGPPVFNSTISLRPFETREFDYVLLANKRGLYHVGPLSIYSGDVFGMADPRRDQYAAAPLMVYPRVVPLEQLNLPSRRRAQTQSTHSRRPQPRTWQTRLCIGRFLAPCGLENQRGLGPIAGQAVRAVGLD